MNLSTKKNGEFTSPNKPGTCERDTFECDLRFAIKLSNGFTFLLHFRKIVAQTLQRLFVLQCYESKKAKRTMM